VAQLSDLGRRIFMDPAYSASGKQSCASCHDPAHDYSPPNDLAVQFGGPDMKHRGSRTVPTLKYLQSAPFFSEHYVTSEEEGDNSTDQGPTGGLMWDGRAPSRRQQAQLPLLDPDEMANPDIAAVVAKVKAAPYADTLRKLFGERVFDNDDKAFKAIVQALDYYQQTPAKFFPYNSKFDAYMMGKAALSEQEMRGLRVFADENKGNCASCHVFAVPGVLPLFNDFGLIGLGVPRNPEIPANADPGYHDMGLCGPKRADLKDHPEYCGLFRSPTLRNVARRKVFFHNGYFHHLRDVVEFYAKRDTNPEKYYPRKPDGGIAKFDDLPDPKYRENINVDPPFGGKPGDPPAMSEQDIDDVVAFLQTLNDGYVPLPEPTTPSPSANPPAR
jgi:cytochrome c peroxidase